MQNLKNANTKHEECKHGNIKTLRMQTQNMKNANTSNKIEQTLITRKKSIVWYSRHLSASYFLQMSLSVVSDCPHLVLHAF